MALTGTLEDISVVDLLQYPTGAKRTGQMAIRGPDGVANLYYVDGALVHAEQGATIGFDVVVNVVDWSVGEFEFHPGRVSDEHTIRGALIHIVMEALKLRDEERRAPAAADHDDELAALKRAWGANDDDDAIAVRRIVDFLQSHAFIRHVSVLDDTGEVIAQATAGGDVPPWLDDLHCSMAQLVDNYPRASVSKLVLEDADGVVVLCRPRAARAILAISGAEATAGAVAMAVCKLNTALDAAPEPARSVNGRRLRRRRATFSIG
jgi:Domain of unknown function (DUF4388)